MFKPSDAPRVFALPLGVDFARQFAAGLRERMAGEPPEAWAKVRLYVNTQRSARRLQDVLTEGGAMILPDIRVVTSLAGDVSLPLPRTVPPLRRRLVLARLVAAYLEQMPDVAPLSAVFDLADSLGDLLDGFHGEGIAMTALNSLDVADHAAHWNSSLQFLDILTTYWEQGREGFLDSEERQRKAAEYLAEHWAQHPPDGPVIVAGSTGSRGATALVMDAVAKLPQGAVVLPGYDYDLPAEVWDSVSIDHPQYGFKRLRDRLGIGTPPLWRECAGSSGARNRLVSLALRPAPVTDQWLSEGPGLAETLGSACSAVTLIEAPGLREEAEAIAVRLRLAAEEGQTAALVSPDRMLTRRVTSVLGRWGITPDDSAGQPVPLTPPGIFLRRVIGVAGGPLTPVALVSILKHPLCGGAEGRKAHLSMTRRLELQVLRGGPPEVDWDALTEWAAKQGEDFPVWIAWLGGNLMRLANVGKMGLVEWLTLHRDVAESLSKGLASEDPPLWQKNAGAEVVKAFDALAAEAEAAGPLEPIEYRALFQSQLTGAEARPDAYLPHPTIQILGTLEARVQSAELVILGGLNEGIWPKSPEPDPWLSRQMRAAIGLPLPERQIGLSAHDFQQAIAAREVVLTRSIRDGEAQTVPSRWMIRLLNLMEGIEGGKDVLAAMRSRGDDLLSLAVAMNHVDPVPAATRPSPRPPVDARPTKLSVTRIETLIRDPYAIYADKILGLRKLDPLGREADALERGTALHQVLHAFIDETRDGLPDDAEALFLRVAERELAHVPWPSARRFWLARLKKVAGKFMEGERARRERGRPSALEVKGDRSANGFTLTAKADRVDVTDTGVAIYDYKSGSPPNQNQIKYFAVQLPLEGAIAQAGGFKDLGAARDVYLELIGLGSEGKTTVLDLDAAAIAKHWDDLLLLIAAYGSRDLGYSARAKAELLSYDSDYDHLSRFGEWQDGDPTVPEDVG